MAKPVNHIWLWRRIKAFSAALSMGLYTLGTSLTTATAADSPGSNLPQSVTVPLTCQETAYSIFNESVSFSAQTAPFPKEPATTGKVFRGSLNLGSNSLSLLWERDAGRLFLDLNHNQDLTDDPVYAVRANRNLSDQTFTNVHLVLDTPSGRIPLTADLNLWNYGSPKWLSCSLHLHSFWQGKVTLGGRDWQLGLIPSVTSAAGDQVLLRSWLDHDHSVNASGTTLETFPFCRKLFLDGQAYALHLQTGPATNDFHPSFELTGQNLPLGELKISGQFVQRLALHGDYLVIASQPGASIKVPTGNYHSYQVLLEQTGTQAWLKPEFQANLSVITGVPGVLTVGGPLTNSVAISRGAEALTMNYKLIGAGGKAYALVNEDRSHPPTFAVYKDGRKIADGSFEFG